MKHEPGALASTQPHAPDDALSGSSGPPQAGRTAARVLDILELLARQPAGLTLSQIARALGAPISSLVPLLRVLESRRYLVRGRDRRRYCLGPQLPEVSRAYLDPAEPFITARRAMHDLAAQCGETLHLAVLAGREVEYLDGTTSRYPLSAHSRVGQRLPAYATAEGKTLLALLPPSDLAQLFADFAWPDAIPWQERERPSFELLERDLEEARWAGYACDHGGIERGLETFAVALPEQPGRPAAALSVTVPAPRLQPDMLRTLVDLLRGVAAPPVTRVVRRRDSPVIGWSLSYTNNLMYTEMRQAAAARAAGTGTKVLWADASDRHKQSLDVHRLLQEPLDALIIHPTNAVEAAPLFMEARERDLLLVCFHRPARTRAFDFFAGSDTYTRGACKPMLWRDCSMATAASSSLRAGPTMTTRAVSGKERATPWRSIRASRTWPACPAKTGCPTRRERWCGRRWNGMDRTG